MEVINDIPASPLTENPPETNPLQADWFLMDFLFVFEEQHDFLRDPFSSQCSHQHQHHAVNHTGQCSEYDDRTGDLKHFGRHAGDEPLALKINGR